jgi:hypothetical protein
VPGEGTGALARESAPMMFFALLGHEPVRRILSGPIGTCQSVMRMTSPSLGKQREMLLVRALAFFATTTTAEPDRRNC